MRKDTAVATVASIGVALGIMLSAAYGQDAAAGPTDIGGPDEIVEARKALMEALETEMVPLDEFAAGADLDLNELQAQAFTIGNLLLVTPHLFPPTTNFNAVPDAAPDVPTSALPAIWDNFDDFYARAKEASALALEAAGAADAGTFRTQATALRQACTSCHDAYLQPYIPPF